MDLQWQASPVRNKEAPQWVVHVVLNNLPHSVLKTREGANCTFREVSLIISHYCLGRSVIITCIDCNNYNLEL